MVKVCRALLASSVFLLFTFDQSMCTDAHSEHAKSDVSAKKSGSADSASSNTNTNTNTNASAINSSSGRSSKVKADESAPAYDEIIPIVGWNRYTGDSARTIKGWVRWWKYLTMKQPVIMEWIDGLVLKIHPGNEVCRSLFVNGIYDPNLIVLVNALLPKGGILLDVGANMGYVSLLATKFVEGAEGHVYAIEPSSRDFERLQDNISINALNDSISAHKVAITDKVGKEKMLIASEERSSLNTLGSDISFKGVEKLRIEEVDTTTIDSFVENEKIKNPISLIKLDIEGSELKALMGSKNTIEKYRPAIILGVNSRAMALCGEADLSALKNLIKELRYFIYKIVVKPTFTLEKTDDLPVDGIVVCLHESIVPPVLTQPKKCSFVNCIVNFFTR